MAVYLLSVRMRRAHQDVVDLTTQEGPEPITNNDMPQEVQTFRTQLCYLLVMMLNEHALEIVRNSPQGVGAEVWRTLLWVYGQGVGIRCGATLQSSLKRRFGDHDEKDLARETRVI